MYRHARIPLQPGEFHDQIYKGAIFRFAGCPAVSSLIAFTREFLDAAFHPHSPPLIHQHYDDAQQAETFALLQRQFSQSEETRRLWRGVFEAVGLDKPAEFACDDLYLRFQPHKDRGAAPPRAFSTATLGFHRDTWGTNLYAQTNWWAPVYPITSGRTFAFFPDLWTRPLRNSTADFDLRAIFERGARGESVNADEGMPHLLEDVDPSLAVPVVIEPGEMIAFSGAHAHAGVPNTTGVTRISLETRSVWIDDFQRGRGAPNVDGFAPWISLALFQRFSDGTPLHKILSLDSFEPFKRPVEQLTGIRHRKNFGPA